jgi:hypothetical protein
MKYIYIIAGLIVINLTACDYFPSNYQQDPDNPGLATFTSVGNNIVTNYINGVAYINSSENNYYNYNDGYYEGNLPTLKKIVTTSTFDTISLSWNIQINNNVNKPLTYPIYKSIAILIPVSKSFNANDFLAFNGRRFGSDSCDVVLTQYNSFNGSDSTVITGTADIYFVQVDLGSAATSLLYFAGLFDGNIGNNVAITKGRFDFAIPTAGINF